MVAFFTVFFFFFPLPLCTPCHHTHRDVVVDVVRQLEGVFEGQLATLNSFRKMLSRPLNWTRINSVVGAFPLEKTDDAYPG